MAKNYTFKLENQFPVTVKVMGSRTAAAPEKCKRMGKTAPSAMAPRTRIPDSRRTQSWWNNRSLSFSRTIGSSCSRKTLARTSRPAAEHLPLKIASNEKIIDGKTNKRNIPHRKQKQTLNRMWSHLRAHELFLVSFHQVTDNSAWNRSMSTLCLLLGQYETLQAIKPFDYFQSLEILTKRKWPHSRKFQSDNVSSSSFPPSSSSSSRPSCKLKKTF